MYRIVTIALLAYVASASTNDGKQYFVSLTQEHNSLYIADNETGLFSVHFTTHRFACASVMLSATFYTSNVSSTVSTNQEFQIIDFNQSSKTIATCSSSIASCGWQQCLTYPIPLHEIRPSESYTILLSVPDGRETFCGPEHTYKLEAYLTMSCGALNPADPIPGDSEISTAANGSFWAWFTPMLVMVPLWFLYKLLKIRRDDRRRLARYRVANYTNYNVQPLAISRLQTQCAHDLMESHQSAVPEFIHLYQAPSDASSKVNSSAPSYVEEIAAYQEERSSDTKGDNEDEQTITAANEDPKETTEAELDGRSSSHHNTLFDGKSELNKWFDANIYISRTNKEKYCAFLIDNGYDSILSLKYITDAQLKNIGIEKIGHRQMILDQIERKQFE